VFVAATPLHWQAERAVGVVWPVFFGQVRHITIIYWTFAQRTKQEVAVQLRRPGCNEGEAHATGVVGRDARIISVRQRHGRHRYFQYAIPLFSKPL
jgi:hypothetical protein